MPSLAARRKTGCCGSWGFEAAASYPRSGTPTQSMTSNARIDSLQLMLTDLRMRNEPIRHKAAFRGCQPEFQALVSRLIEQLEGELLDEKQRSREASRQA